MYTGSGFPTTLNKGTQLAESKVAANFDLSFLSADVLITLVLSKALILERQTCSQAVKATDLKNFSSPSTSTMPKPSPTGKNATWRRDAFHFGFADDIARKHFMFKGVLYDITALLCYRECLVGRATRTLLVIPADPDADGQATTEKPNDHSLSTPVTSPPPTRPFTRGQKKELQMLEQAAAEMQKLDLKESDKGVRLLLSLWRHLC